jgi:tRNA A-37 threonylcarbamoyl transferase component Bud32
LEVFLDSRLVLPANAVLDGDYRIMRVVGSGGFGITYEAEDLNLGTTVAIKEYYPIDFGERDATMSVRPKSERHKSTFEKGRTNFLQEARTLARFEHAAIVRVSRVFEANSTAYMVMRFEQGMSLEGWLRRLERPPTQNELDLLVAPLLDSLEMMHAADFLHRDIAPDNIIVRADGTPVLLDFGAARRAVAEMSRSLTGIVKAGYSPHEQYATDGRLQGPWSDLYAFGATLYRAVTGRAPEEVMLRVDEDHMRPAVEAARGAYRREFLAAIDACLKVKHGERPRSVAQLRPMLLGRMPHPATERLVEPTHGVADVPARSQQVAQAPATWRWAAIAAVVAVALGSYAGYEYQRLDTTAGLPGARVVTATVDASAARKAEEQARERHAALDAEQRREERQKEQAAAAEAEARRRAEEAAERRRREQERIAAIQEARRKEEAAAADEKRREEQRIAALDEARRNEEGRKQEERRLAAIPDAAMRADLVRKVQEVLKRARCYDGAINGHSADAQAGLDRFVGNAGRKGLVASRIDLTKASVGDFEAWLKDTDAIRGQVCPVSKPPPVKLAPAERKQPVAKAATDDTERPKAKRAPSESGSAPRDTEACLNTCHAAGGNHWIQRRCNRRCGGS